jgi:ectoine hydroxylase-related dioxygenase (phytanoyl-CoA dioxygenase family)
MLTISRAASKELRAGYAEKSLKSQEETMSLLESNVTAGHLSAEEIAARYDRDGFVVIPDVISREECLQLKAEGLRVLKEHASPKATVYVGVAAASDVFYKLASDPRIIEYLKPLMPDGIMFMSDKFVFKSGEQRFGTPWHCDEAYWHGTRPKISIWIPLDDVTAANGALRVIPGGHKQNWEHANEIKKETNGEFFNYIGKLQNEAPGEITCEMSAGSLLIFSDLLPHASTENTAGADRYAIISTYHSPVQEEPFDLQFPARHVVA